MYYKLFLIFLLAIGLASCQKAEKNEKSALKAREQLSDRVSNDGMLRFVLAGKSMHDEFFIAQFTPQGNLFEKDNLQLCNYNIGSDKYPQFIININHDSSNLKEWEGKTFPLDFLAFTPASDARPLDSEGNILFTKITDTSIEGKFSGNLINRVSGKKYPIRGEFKAIIELNV
jgi:hypothetical protein